MKRGLTVVVLVVVLAAAGSYYTAIGTASTTSAQDVNSAGQIAQLKERLAETRARLNLTDDQAGQIRPILLAGFEARIAVLEKHGIDIGNQSGAAGQVRPDLNLRAAR